MRILDHAHFSTRPAPDHATGIDEHLLGLLPWLASRFDLSDGSFRGEGGERDRTPEVLTAQGRACLQALGIHDRLPHVVRAKLDQWPEPPPALRAAETGSLARTLRTSVKKNAADFQTALAPYSSPDGGYALKPRDGSPGSMAAAYQLLVVARPAWFAGHELPLPTLSAAVVEAFTERLLATHAP